MVRYMARLIKKNCLALMILSVSTMFNTVNAETIQITNDHQFSESFSENVSISGSVRVGVMYSSSSRYVTPDSLYIDIGLKSDQILCVKMLSVDGQYEADFAYPLAGNISGRIHFELPTRFQDVVATYTPDQLAVLAEIKSVCKGGGGRIVPASWGEPIPGDVKVYLNSGVNKTFLKLYKANGSSDKISCSPIQSGKSTAYDTVCIIPGAGSYNLERTKIIRINFGNYSKPVKLKIYTSKGFL